MATLHLNYAYAGVMGPFTGLYQAHHPEERMSVKHKYAAYESGKVMTTVLVTAAKRCQGHHHTE